MRNITIGIDLAKSVFSTCTVDATGRVRIPVDLTCCAGMPLVSLLELVE